jgi:hypothetical protein
MAFFDHAKGWETKCTFLFVNKDAIHSITFKPEGETVVICHDGGKLHSIRHHIPLEAEFAYDRFFSKHAMLQAGCGNYGGLP